VDLTPQGTADWVLYGRQGFDAQRAIALDRKANVAPLIGVATRINYAWWWAYGDNAITYSAEDGTQSFAPSTVGIFSPNPAAGYQIEIGAGLTERTATIYVGAYRSQGQFEAYLSDGSAPLYVDTSTDSGSQNLMNHVYSIRFHAASEGQKLIVKYTLLANHNYGNVTLQAITVNGQPRPFPVIQALSHTTDTAGTLIWITGANFGPNMGSVLFNGVAAQILSWSDTQIQLLVPAGATSGPVIVSVDGANSNSVGFTVLGGGGSASAVTLLPTQASMLVGDTRSFRALDASGLMANVSNWSSSDTSIADFGPDPDNPTGPPLLTAKASGQVTINADSSSATVTVYSGTTFPAGTVMWTVPSTASLGFAVQAMPTSDGVADLFVVQPSGAVQALKADGTLAWTASLGFDPSGVAYPDPKGGLIGIAKRTANTPDVEMTRLDPSGRPSWGYRPGVYYFDEKKDMAIQPDGTIFQTQGIPDGSSGALVSVVAIDGVLGTEKFRVPLQNISGRSDRCDPLTFRPQYGSITIAPDGTTYLEYVTSTTLSCSVQGSYPNNYTRDESGSASLRILRVNPDGSSTDTELRSWSATSHLDHQRAAYNSTQVEQLSVTPAPAPLFSLAEVIPDNHGNMMASWSFEVPSYSQTCTWTNPGQPNQTETCSDPVGGQGEQAHVSLLNGTTLQNDFTLDGVDNFNAPMVMGEGDVAFAFGYKDSDFLNRAAAFNTTTGASVWTSAPFAGDIKPIAPANGGTVIKREAWEGAIHESVVRYDANGNESQDGWALDANGQALYDVPAYYANNLWTVQRADSSIAAIYGEFLDYDLGYLAFPNGSNFLSHSASAYPVYHFVPVDPAPPGTTTHNYPDLTYESVPESVAGHLQIKHIFKTGLDAKVQSFLDTLRTKEVAIGLITHSREFFLNGDLNNPIVTYGFAFGDGSLMSDQLPANADFGTERLTKVSANKMRTQAKIIFIGACRIGQPVEDWLGITSTTQGRALIVPNSELTGLGYSVAAWWVILDNLHRGVPLTEAVRLGNNYVAQHPDPNFPFIPVWSVVGDSNVGLK